MKTRRCSIAPFVPALLAIVLLLCPVLVPGQTTLENIIKENSGETVKGYIQPIADLFGANMHAGFQRSARIPSSGFTFALDLVGMVAMVGDDQKSYTAPTPPGFDPKTFKTATIFGGKGSEVQHATIPSLKYKGSDGVFNTSIFPIAAPQIRIGSLFGTEAAFRFLPIPKIGEDKTPSGTLWGIGVRHSISQYIPASPLDIAAGVYYSSFTAGDIIDFKGITIAAQASKSFSIVTLYGGLAWEKSTLGLKYTSKDATMPAAVDISLDGAEQFRATAGIDLSLLILHVFADANFGSVTHFSGGIGFGF